jgi:ABC-type uncharacterized transport system permease subunit
MQATSIFWLRVAAALYSVGVLHAMLTVLKRPSKLFDLSSSAFSLGVTFHLVALVDMAFALGHLPVDNLYETLSLCGFLIALSFQFVSWRYQFSSLSVILFPLVFFMTLVGATEIPVAGWSNPNVRQGWLLVHVILVLIGYAAMLVTAVASLFYLVQERHLKRKSTSAIFNKLPPLGTLDALISNSMGAGFVFITLATIAGVIWAFVDYGTHWLARPAVIISLLTWGFYLVMVFLRANAGWRGRKAAFMALSLVGFSALTWAAHVGLKPLIEK